MKPWHIVAISAAVLVGLVVWYFASSYDLFGGPPRPDEIAGAADAVPRVDPTLKTNHDPAPTKPAAATPQPAPVAPRPQVTAPENGPSAPAERAPTVANAIALTEPGTATSAPAASDAGTRYALNTEGIRAAINSAVPEMKECYEAWQKLDPSLQEKMTISFVLSSDGGQQSNFDEVHVMAGPDVGHVAFEGCVLSVVSSLRFDAPAGGGQMMVRYPMTFSPGDGGD